jgi:hypothetical protein
MIDTSRFLVRSSDREAWLEARSNGVTATMVSRGATPQGYKDVVAEIHEPIAIEPSSYMSWGNEREPFIAMRVKELFGVMPNEWVIAKDSGLNKWQMATPDGLSLDHQLIGEYKTTGKPLDKIPAHYMRQVQWQLYVTDASACVFAYEIRNQRADGSFYPDLDIETQMVERDDSLISKLIDVAEKIQMNIVYKSQIQEG